MNYKTFIVREISSGRDELSAFALIFEGEDSCIVLPVVIGSGEARAISFGMKNSAKSTIPLTHDVFSKFVKDVGYHVDRVEIYQIVDGVFLSNITLKNDDGNTITLDARTSDAVAMALRFSAPIHATEAVISEAGVTLSFNDLKQKDEQTNPVGEGYEAYSTEVLQELLEIAVKKEDFDVAIELDRELKKREKEN